MTFTRILRLVAIVMGVSTLTSQAQVLVSWDYSWNGALAGNNNGGVWQSMASSMGTTVVDNGPNPNNPANHLYSLVSADSLSFSATLGDVGGLATDALFLVITNDANAPSSSDANWASIYLAPNGSMIITPYANDPATDHALPTSIYNGSYSKVDNGLSTTFNFNLDAAALNTILSPNTDPWEGLGFPFDNDGQTAGNQFTPYRMGIWARSYLTGSIAYNGGIWDVNDGLDGVGFFDDAHDFVTGPMVPEPTGFMLGGLAILICVFSRKRKP